MTYDELKSKFPDRLQGREIFATKIETRQKSDRQAFVGSNEITFLVNNICLQ